MGNFIDMQNARTFILRNNDNGVVIQFDCIIYFYYLLTVFHQEFSKIIIFPILSIIISMFYYYFFLPLFYGIILISQFNI